MIVPRKIALRAGAAAAACGLLACAGTARAGADGWAGGPGGGWIGGWEAPVTGGGPHFGNETVRMVVHVSTGGREVRLRLSNRYGRGRLVLGAVRIAERGKGAAIVPGTGRTVTFHGRREAAIAPGGGLTSDPVRLPVTPGEDLLVSVYLPRHTGAATFHPVAQDTSYLATAGDRTRDLGASAFRVRTGSWYFLTGLDVLPEQESDAGTVVAFGDSITDGNGSAPGSNTRWPDYLARRLADFDEGEPLGVANAGISANRLLTDGSGGQVSAGPSGLHRFGRDVLAEPGVRTVIVLEGINDIGLRTLPDGRPVTARRIIDGYRALIDRAHRAGVRVIGATLTPYRGAGYFTPAGERIREAVNRWIRTSGAFDGVADFDRAVADPDDPQRLLPAYDCGDHLHPDSAGYRAMAAAVGLEDLLDLPDLAASPHPAR